MSNLLDRLSRVGERIGIPCPDNKKGCLVFHFRIETDPVCLEAIEYIKELEDALRKIAAHDLQAIALKALSKGQNP